MEAQERFELSLTGAKVLRATVTPLGYKMDREVGIEPNSAGSEPAALPLCFPLEYL